MACNVVAIYNALAAMTVTVGAVTPSVYVMDTTKDWTDSADLPLRLMTIMGAQDEGREGQVIMLKPGLGQIIWQVHDLLLWEAAGLGAGLADHMKNLITYAGAYVDALLNTYDVASATGSDALIENWRIIPGVYEFPAGSGASYYGVDCIVLIKEWVQ